MHLGNHSLASIGSQKPDPALYNLGKKLAAARSTGKPGVGPSAATTTSAPGAPAPPITPDLAEAEPLTLKGLKKAWGKDDQRYDLNRDGKVGMADMLTLLAQMRGEEPSGGGPPLISGIATPDPGAPSAGPVGAAEENAPPSPLTLEGLMAVWGKSDERYDLNRDGIVNMADLVELIAQLSPPQEPSSPPTPPVSFGETVGVGPSIDQAPPVKRVPEAGEGIGSEDPAADEGRIEPLTIDGLMEVWGEASEHYDFNDDGVVNMEDLLTLLSQLSEGSTGEPAPSGISTLAAQAPPSLSTEGPVSEEQPSDPLTLEGLLEAWGKASDQYDFDNDGVVGMHDLLTLLSRSGADGVDGNDLPQFKAAHRLATTIMNELKEGGFANQPPVNIHQLVGSLNLQSSLEKQLMEHLSKEYPRGLGVNMVG